MLFNQKGSKFNKKPSNLLEMVEVAVPTRVHIRPLPSVSPHLPIRRNIVSTNTKACKIRGAAGSSSSSTSNCGYKQPVDDGQIVLPNKASKKRVFFLDVNPLCYAGSRPSLHAFAHWVSLFFNQFGLSDIMFNPLFLLNSFFQ